LFKFQITSTKLQTNLNFQYQMTKTTGWVGENSFFSSNLTFSGPLAHDSFNIWNFEFGYWNLFDICDL